MGNAGAKKIADYFTKILEDNLKAITKPQYVDQIPKALKEKNNRSVGALITTRCDVGEARLKEIRETLGTRYLSHFNPFSKPTNAKLELDVVWDRDIDLLSGGELQRFAIGMVCVQKADVYMFDEPSSFLDVKQRLAAGRLIRSLLGPDSYVIVVEHDLSILDYLSDYICVLYGKPAVYGVVTAPFSVREGINIFLDGNVPTENLRFRDESLQFRIGDASEDFLLDKTQGFTYPAMEKTMGNFHLKIDPGTFTGSEILVMMGENGTGKTTFCKMLAGALKPDNDQKIPPMNISMKPQKITPKFQGTVRQLFFKRIKAAFINPQFQTDVYKPLKMDDFIDQEVQNLSGGELQRVAIVLALGMPADIYVIDEPSAYLDSEQRIVASRVIKRFIMHAKKTAFVVEHDFIMATYLADRVIVFDGEPSIETHANTPESLLTGCNTFLKALDVTFRRDPSTYRPRINKLNSVKDAEQKAAGSYVSSHSSISYLAEKHTDQIIAVLPGRRILRGIAQDYDRDAAAGCNLSGQSSRRAGTKRRRVIKSGADELLDLEGAETDDNDDGDPVIYVHYRHHILNTRNKSWLKRWCNFQSTARQRASAIRKSSHASSPSMSFGDASAAVPVYANGALHATSLWATTTTNTTKA
jgi:ATP-binding cassette subfamily E protein 1